MSDSVHRVLRDAADKINAGALGPNASATYSGPSTDDVPNTVTFDAAAMAGVRAIGKELRRENGNGHKPAADTGDLPESLLERLRSHYGETDTAFWAMGDDIDDAVVESAGKLTQKRVYAIAAKEMNLSTAEVRLLHETARETDESLRDEFTEILTHQHYREVRYLHDRAVKRKYLTWCVESADQWGGRVATAARLKKKIQAELGETKPDPTVGEILERAVAVLDRALALDPKAVCRELSRYAERMSADPAAGQAKGELAFAASELLEAAKAWGKAA